MGIKMQKIKNFLQQETVLCIAAVLAAISTFFVKPDRQYLSYIDFRTLAILFCLMTIIAAFKQIGIFDKLATTLLKKVHTTSGAVFVLVLLCFTLSMFITNDVALITFVPLSILVIQRIRFSTSADRNHCLITCAVMQTIAANLGSMLTPIGNPQNLFLYGKANENGTLTLFQFMGLMLPYCLLSLILLILWILLFRSRSENMLRVCTLSVDLQQESPSEKGHSSNTKEFFVTYLFLFILSLLAVAHKISFMIPLILVLLYSLLRNHKVMKDVDYSLLATFLALFVFIGNLGRIPLFETALCQILEGRELLTAVLASQVMSNVPAAVLLSRFTENTNALIIGTNLGGLGTLIASMASLISFKYIAREDSALRGKYIVSFTAANVIFLAALLLLSILLA